MKKMLSVSLILALCLVLFSGCGTEAPEETPGKKIVYPLPETLDVNNLADCTVAVSFEKGDAYVDDSGKMQMKVKVYTYDLYDMVDVASLNVGDSIVRLGEEVKITSLERLDIGLVRINGGEEKGGFDLVSSDSTVYYETGMSDVKAYYELGEAALSVSEDFVYLDESDLDAKAKEYYSEDFLSNDSGIEYDFNPNNTTITIENGEIVRMNKYYMP